MNRFVLAWTCWLTAFGLHFHHYHYRSWGEENPELHPEQCFLLGMALPLFLTGLGLSLVLVHHKLLGSPPPPAATHSRGPRTPDCDRSTSK